ncbi:MAG: alpha/beta hydrolase [Enhygromyxa sp.]
MPSARVNGVELYYDERGRGEQTVVFAHGLLWSGRMYEAQLRALAADYRVIAWDHRGQGRSSGPPTRAHQIETCYHDALTLLEHLQATPCHFVGLSMGGFVGMRLAARHPSLLRSLSLLATAADAEPAAHLPRYRLLTAIVRRLGPRPVAARVLPIMFGPSFLTDPARAAERERWRGELLRNDRSIHRAVTGVIERERCDDELANIRCPVLVLHGDEDQAISRSRALATHEQIANSRFVAIESAGHSMTIENPDAVTHALREFLASASSDPISPSESG